VSTATPGHHLQVRAAAAVGYATLLTRLVPLAASPKHDVLVGVPSEVLANGRSLDGILCSPDHDAGCSLSTAPNLRLGLQP
jgi:hypothetical protein